MRVLRRLWNWIHAPDSDNWSFVRFWLVACVFVSLLGTLLGGPKLAFSYLLAVTICLVILRLWYWRSL